MTFSENTNLTPGGQSASPSKVKELENRIDDLQQTVTSVADSVANLADEVNTHELNADEADITNAVIDNATVGAQTVMSEDVDTLIVRQLQATTANIDTLESDTAEVRELNSENAYFGSANAQSFTGQNVNVSEDVTASNKVQGKTVQATEKVVTPALESTQTELKGATTVRGDVYFPETGDKIYGEYLEVDAETVKAKSLTKKEAIDTHKLVGYDDNGELIPVDATKTPAVLWELDEGNPDLITPKNNRKVKCNVTIDGEDYTDVDSAIEALKDYAEKVDDEKIDVTLMGVANGVATLDNAGKIPSSQLPGYVDDVIEGYYNNGNFYKDSDYTDLITPEEDKIYIDLSSNKTYRWSGSAYIVIASDLALGETSATAYRGDRGKTAYDHSQLTSGNPHNVTKSDVGLSNVPNVTTNNQTPTYTTASSNTNLTSGETLETAFGKIAKAISSLISHLSNTNNPHSVTKSQVGLGNVDNTADADKSVNYAGSAGSAGSATNATYATKIGTSSSHPSVGSSTNPVYVNSAGTLTSCSLGNGANATFSVSGSTLTITY